MSLELERTFNPAATNDSKDGSVVPQFVSILNSKRLEPSAEADKKCTSPTLLASPKPCVGNPAPPCYGTCYGK